MLPPVPVDLVYFDLLVAFIDPALDLAVVIISAILSLRLFKNVSSGALAAILNCSRDHKLNSLIRWSQFIN